MRIKIKSFPDGTSVTGKYQLLDPNEKVGKSKLTHRDKGYRALEIGEVIDFPDEEATTLLQSSNGVLEITTEPANRPLYFGDPGTAKVTSNFYNIDSPEREEEQKKGFARVAEIMGL